MNIQGVNVLSQKILYSPQWFGIAIGLFFAITGFIILFEGLDGWYDSLKIFYIGVINIVIFVIVTGFASTEKTQTFLNKPDTVQYEIEIIDDNAWKELGPKYNILEKIYENKEIYRIEGEYVNDNT